MRSMKRLFFAVIGMIALVSLVCLSACRNDTYTLRFETDGGTEIPAIEAEAGAEITPPADPVKSGFYFEGWYLDSGFSGERVTIPNKMPAENRTYYAKWTDKTGNVTMHAGEGGTLSEETVKAPFDASLKEFLSGKTPSVKEGARFAGWYLKTGESYREVGDGDKVSENVEVFARYHTDITVKVYLQDAQGAYPESSEDLSVEAWLGESYRYSETREHFTLDPEKSASSLEKVEIGSSLTIYYQRNQNVVFYEANLPEGVEAGGEIESVSVLYEGTLQLADGNDYAVQSGYRFMGWATEEDGPKVYDAGEEITVTENLVLYAVWASAYTDAFGGGDLLYVISSDKAILTRQYFEDIECAYDEATGIFTIMDGEKEVVSGKVSGAFFYYFKDAMMATYTHAEKEGVTLSLSDKGVAVYTDGSSVNGNYAVDEETGDWKFESESTNFFFSVDAVAKTFVIADENRGFYGYNDGENIGFPIFFLDGMGGALMLYPPQNPYVDSYGLSYSILEGTYVYDEETNVFEMTVRAGADGYLRFYIHIEKNGTDVSGVELAGTYTLLNIVPGWYSENAYLDTEPDLFIDGLGGGEYQGKEGKYTLHPLGWYNNSMFGVGEINHDYIVFEVDGSDEEYVFVLTMDDDGNLDYNLLDEEPEIHFYDEEGLIINGVFYSKAMLFFRHDQTSGNVELWTYNEESSMLYGVEIYDSLCSGTATEVEGQDGLYFYEGSYWNTDYSHYFRYNGDGTLHFSMDELKLMDGEKKLVISTDGKAYYTPENGSAREVEYEVFEVAVGVTERTHIQKIYLFDLGTNGTPDIYAFKYLVTQDENGAEEVKIEAVEKEDFLDTGFIAHNTYGARIVILPDNKAVIAALMSSGSYTVYFYGDLTAQENDVFSFHYTFNGYPYEDGGAFEDQYGSFSFKRFEAIGGYVFLIYDGNPLNITCESGHFETDGYGNAKLKIGDEEIEGLYIFVEDLIEVSAEDGSYIYVKVTGDSFKIIDLEEKKEAGYIYTVDEEGYLVTSIHFFFDGDGTALYTDSNGTRTGKYEYLGVKELDGEYDEYRVTLEDDVVMTIVVRYGTVGDQVFAVFYLRDESALFEIEVEGGGKISGDGYNLTEYETADGTILYGMGNLCLIADTNYYNHAYAATPEGNVLVLRVLNEDRTEFTEELIFDLSEKNGKKVATLRELPFGLNIKFEDNTLVYSEYLYLDGKGNAEIRTNYGENFQVSEKGTYAEYPELGENVYVYRSENSDHTFVFSMRVEVQYNPYSGIMYVYEYCVYHAETDNTYYGEKYEVLKLDGFGRGVYIDKYGVVSQGTYQNTIAENTIGFNVNSSDTRYYFNLNAEEDKFESASRGDFVVSGEILIAYVGADTVLRIPDGIKRIMAGAIPQSVAEIDFNEVEILDDNALQYHYSITKIESDTIRIVGANAFNGTNATEIILPNAEEIGDQAFMTNSQLTKLVLGKVKKIGAHILDRSNYMSALVIDLTKVEDLTQIEIDPTAFDLNAYTSGLHIFFQRILVKDLAAVNTIMSSDKWPQAAKNFVYFESASSEADGSYYFSLTHHTIYRLDKALIKDVEDVRDDGQLSQIKSEVRGLYTYENGKLNLYLKQEDGTFSTTATVIDNADTLTLENETFYKSGVALKRTADSKDLSFTVEVSMSPENWYTSWRDIYNFSGSAVYDGKKASTFTFDYEKFEFTFVTDDDHKAYHVTEIEKETCQIEYQGLIVTKTVEFAGYSHTVTVSLDDSNQITSVREVLRDFGWGNPSAETILTQVKNDDGSLSFELSGWEATDWFKVSYDAGKDTLTVEAEKITRIMRATVEVDETTSVTYILNLEMDPAGKILKLLSFKIQDVYPYTDWDIDEEETKVNDDGTMTIVVTDTEGTQHKFTATVKPAGTYPNITFTLTLTEEK